MLYFLDTEFIESGPNQPIYLMSIGIVSEDNRQLYLVNKDCPFDKANNWVKVNVIPNLKRYGYSNYYHPLEFIKQSILLFIGLDKPTFWGYYAGYDWVVFCQIFGTMIDLPKGWPMFCYDIKQWCNFLGNPKLPEQNSIEHNALHDAIWNKQAYEFLLSKEYPEVIGRINYK